MSKIDTIEESKYSVSILGGLGVGRTSILDILIEKYDFRFQETVIVFEYHSFSYDDFLASYGYIDFYDIDLALFIVDIQNRVNSVRSKEFLDAMLTFFRKKKIKIITTVLFHKYDPELKAYYDHDLQERATDIKDMISRKHRKAQVYYQETSIHDKKLIEDLHILISRLSRIKI